MILTVKKWTQLNLHCFDCVWRFTIIIDVANHQMVFTSRTSWEGFSLWRAVLFSFSDLGAPRSSVAGQDPRGAGDARWVTPVCREPEPESHCPEEPNERSIRRRTGEVLKRWCVPSKSPWINTVSTHFKHMILNCQNLRYDCLVHIIQQVWNDEWG